MEEDQQFLIQWSEHQSVVGDFLGVDEKERGGECILSAERQDLTAHKKVLSVCSPYLADILSKQYTDEKPVIIFNGVKFKDVKAIVGFMYNGEINVSQNDFSLMETAGMWQVKGLLELSEILSPFHNYNDDIDSKPVLRFEAISTLPHPAYFCVPEIEDVKEDSTPSSEPTYTKNEFLNYLGLTKKQIDSNNTHTSLTNSLNMKCETEPYQYTNKNFKRDISSANELTKAITKEPNHNTNKSYDHPTNQQFQPETRYSCETCTKTYKYISTLRRHIKFECGGKSPTQQCLYCTYKCKQPGNLAVHFRKYHPEMPKLPNVRRSKNNNGLPINETI